MGFFSIAIYICDLNRISNPEFLNIRVLKSVKSKNQNHHESQPKPSLSLESLVFIKDKTKTRHVNP